MQLRAIRVGYDNVRLRQPGDVFPWPDGQPIPSWAQDAALPFEPVKPDTGRHRAPYAVPTGTRIR